MKPTNTENKEPQHTKATMVSLNIDGNKQIIGICYIAENELGGKSETIENVVKLIELGDLDFYNIDKQGESINITDGTFDDYSRVDQYGYLVGESKIVILGKSKFNRFSTVDYTGHNIVEYSESELIDEVKANKLKLANGKIENNHIIPKDKEFRAYIGIYEKAEEARKKASSFAKTTARLKRVVYERLGLNERKQHKRK